MTLLLMMACHDPTVRLDAVAAALADQGPRADGDGLLMDVADETWTVRATLFDDPPSLRFSTSALFRLDDLASPAATVRLLTAVATLDHHLPLGRLSLDATTGEVVLSVDQLVTAGLDAATARRALAQLITEARAVQPRLERAATP